MAQKRVENKKRGEGQSNTLTFQIGNDVVVTKDISSSDTFGQDSVIPKGTRGIITDKNVTTTTYSIKHISNIEMTFGDKRRILLPLNTKKIKKV